MAVKLCALVWACPALRPSEKIVLLRIADRTNGEEYEAYLAGRRDLPGASPGQRSIAADTGLTRETTARVLRKLEQLGVLRIEAGAGTRPARYFVHGHALTELGSGLADRPRRRRASGLNARPQVFGCGLADSPLDEPANSTLRPNLEPSVDYSEPSSGLADGPKPGTGVTGFNRGEEPEVNSVWPEPGAPVPFRVYAAIAGKALDHCITKKCDSLDAISAEFKRGCIRNTPPVPYDSEITRKAIDAARVALNKARAEFNAEMAAKGFSSLIPKRRASARQLR